MAQRRPAIETKSITEVRSNLSAVTKEVYAGEARIAVKKSDIPLQGVVSIQDLRRLKRLEKDREEWKDMLDRFRVAFQDVPSEELEREIEKAIAEDRRERREARALAAAENSVAQ